MARKNAIMSATATHNLCIAPSPEPEAETAMILVVEDDVSLLRLIEKRLAAGGHRAVGVASGSEALTWLKQDSPALILLDYSLPDMRGEQLIEQIQAQGRHVPFVVATGHGSESVAVDMMKRGAYDYLVKDASFMKLLPAVVSRALERARQAQRLIQAEEQLREAHAELECRVEHRTAELAQANRRLQEEMEERRRAEQQVQQHQAELAHVTRLNTVGEMVVELTHELNQPLSAISSYAQACKRLLRSADPVDQAELLSSLSQVGEQADRASEIIRRLRRFVAKGQQAQTRVDVNAMIREVAELTNIDARMSNAQVGFELTDPLPPVLADRIQLEQVMVNLMRNAFEAMRDNKPELRRLTVRTSRNHAQQILVEVHDTGGGIPPGVIEHVFDRFFTTKTNGMGMGLPISQSIIGKHGGKLWVTPNTDRGSTFYFTLPIEPGEHSHGS
jgi:C4-dicarboxylate-specific signal transduction histidine kinase